MTQLAIKRREASGTRAPLSPQTRRAATARTESAQRHAGWHTLTTPIPTPGSGVGGGPLVLRKCACGGTCPRCTAKGGVLADLQHDVSSRPRLSQPGDALELEADRMARHALLQSGRAAQPRLGPPAPAETIHRTCAECELEEEQQIHRRADPLSPAPPGAAVATVPGAGRPLDAGTRSVWEDRFGHGFEHVRIHTGHQADEAARRFGARAYTYGPHVAFRRGEYSPETSAGAQLLAHELAHVVQQGGGILRQPSPNDLATFDAIVAEIRGWDTYKDLEPPHKDMADAIVSDARLRDNALYYARKLSLLFKIPSPAALSAAEAAQVEQETIEMNRGAIEDSLDEEKNRAAGPGYQNDVEEAAAKERDRTNKWETRQGDGATYRVDVSDYDNLVVQLKLHLIPMPGSKTTADDIAKMERVEQGVERAAARVGGYLFDLQFSHVDGPDVFTVGADIGDWPTSGNIVGGAEMLVHEVHHRLRLPDRYDYIEAHAENEAMSVPQRLRLFQRQMARGITDPLAPYSLMDEGGPGSRLTDEDVCLVADPAHAEECIAKRNRVELELIRLRAWGEAVRAWDALVDVIAGDSPLAGANAQHLAELIFREPVPAGDLASRALAMAAKLGTNLRFNVVLSTSPGALQEKPGFANRGNLKCQTVPLWANVVDVVSGAAGGGTPGAPSISICSHALMENEKCQTQSMLVAAAEMIGLMPFVGRGCPYYECTRPSGVGVQSADSWAQFIDCFSKTLGGP